MAYKIIAVMKDGTTINQEIDDAVALAARYADLVHGRETMYVAVLDPVRHSWRDKHYSGRETTCLVDGAYPSQFTSADGGVTVALGYMA